MWLSQNEIQVLLSNAKKDESRIDFRLFAPNNASILTNVIKGDKSIKISEYYNLMSLCALKNHKKQENKENISTTLTVSQHFPELEKQLRKQATEFDKVNNKYKFDPSKIDYLGNSYDYHRVIKWKKLFSMNSEIMNNQTTSLNNWVVDEVWKILDKLRKKELIFENLKLNYYNPKKQFYVSEVEAKKVLKTGKLHYLKYRVSKTDLFKLNNLILDQVDSTLAQHITYQNDIITRIKVLTERKPKKTSLASILGLSKSEYEDFNNSYRLSDIEDQKNLEYLQGHLMVMEQNIETLKKVKTILLYNYDTSIIVGFDNLWHSLFTLALALKKDVEFSIYYLSKTKELVIVPESEAINILGVLLEDNVVNAPELSSKVKQFKDSNEFFAFLKAGFQKIASIKSQDLEGMSLDLVGDIDIDSVEYTSRANIGRIIIDDHIVQNNITAIHQFNKDTFVFLDMLKFPIFNKLSSQGKLINLGHKFSSLENYIASYSENYLVEIFEREGDYFASKSNVQIEKIYSADDAVTELYPLPEKNWFINFPDSSPLAGRNEWAMPLPIFSNENKELWVSSFEELTEKAVNPMFKVVLGKNLKYENFESSKAVLLSDSTSKIPLGLSTTQFRSKNLTELRKERRIEWSVFCVYADKIYEEILSLFEKYEVVQIQFSQEESLKFQNWFFGKEENYQNHNNAILYFYKKIYFNDDGTFSEDKQYNYLNPHKNNLNDIYLKDDFENLYSFSNLTLDYQQEIKFLDVISLKGAFESNTSVYYQTSNLDHVESLMQNYEFIYEKPKTVKGVLISNIDQNEDIDTFTRNYEEELVRFSLFKNSLLSTSTIEILQQQEYILADNLVKFFSHRSQSIDGSKDDVCVWFSSYTLEFTDKIKTLAASWSIKDIYNEIYEYIEVLNSLVFPILKQIPINDKGIAQNEMVNILNNFIYIITPYLPYYSEKIFQVIYKDKYTNSVEYPLHINTLRNASTTIKDKISNILKLKQELKEIRDYNNIPEYQGLYADFSFINSDQQYIKYLQIYLNLIPKSLMQVDGQIEKIIFQNNPISIDLVIDTSLKAIAAQKELSKIIINWKNKNNIKLRQISKLHIRYELIEDDKVLNKLKLNSYWPELFTETIWSEKIVKNEIDTNQEEVYKLLDIVNVQIQSVD